MDYLLCGNLPYPAWKKHISVQNLSNRRIRRYLVCRLKRPEARDFSHVRFTIGRSETYKKHRNQYDVIKINMQEFLSATSGIDEMLRMLNDYLIFDLREQYSQVRFRDEKNLVQVMKDLTYDNEKENVSIPNREVSQEYINAISRFPFCNTTMKARCGRIFLSLFSVPACSV